MVLKDYKYILIILLVFAGATAETDIFLPALSDIMAYFGVGEAKVQELLTWNFIGMCISGPIYGPVSDAYGRRKPMFVGLTLFLIGSLITVFANEFNYMLLGRFIQGLGCGGCFAMGTAILFDAFKGRRAVQALVRINGAIPVMISTAPLFGAYLNLHYGFRSNFLAIAVMTLVGYIVTILLLEETLPVEERKALSWDELVTGYTRALKSKPFVLVTAMISVLFAFYMAYLSISCIFFVKQFGMNKADLPYFQGAVLFAWLAASGLAGIAVNLYGERKVKLVGIGSLAMGALGFAGVMLFAPEDPYAITAAMICYGFGFNWVQTLYFSESLDEVRDINGVTASLRTSCRLLFGSTAITTSGWLYDGTIYPIATMLIGAVIVSILMLLAYERYRSQNELTPLEASSDRTPSAA